MLKRLIDFSSALLGVLLFLPFFPLVWLIVKFSSQSSVFTREDRVGKNNKSIRLYRFSVSSGANGEDGSLTYPVRVLRFLRLDGWPLLTNVLKGDLSLVGPRPEKPEFVKKYTEEQTEVLTVRPGIWGPFRSFAENSTNGEYESGDEYYQKHVLPKKIEVELKYVQNKFLGRDIKVLLNLFANRVRQTINEQLMKEAKNRNFFLPLDLILILSSYILAYQLRFDWSVPANEYLIFFKSFAFVLILRVITFYYSGLYKNLWKYVGIKELLSIIAASAISSVLIIAIVFMFGDSSHSRSIFFIDWILCIFLIGGSRLVLRLFNESVSYEKKLRDNVLIIGAGDVGEMLLRELNKNGRDNYNVVGFIDDDDAKHGRTLHGIKILGACEDIPELAQMLRIDEVLITVNQFSSQEMKAIVDYCKRASVRHRIVPAVCDLISGDVHLSRFRKVEISDLFGREPIELNLSAIENFLHGRRILVTGAGGSIGSELCRQISEYHPESIILVDKNENYLHETRCDLASYSESINVLCSLSDITNKRKQSQLFKQYKPEIVFHAAAHKHVPLSEENPEEAVYNNVVGTKVIADLADEFGVGAFVMVSTDKAVNPTSIMGTTKRIAELYTQALSQKSRTRFVTVRFGNVLNSNGSVVPIFMKQIERGGPVTVTDPVVERYFMSIAEAVQLILQAATMGKSSQIFILNMGKSMRILDLAIELIHQSGLRPYEDIEIKFTGLRSGEKMYEELIGRDEELVPTSHDGIKTLQSKNGIKLDQLNTQIEQLTKSSSEMHKDKLIQKLKEIVPEYEASTVTTSPVNLKQKVAAHENESELPGHKLKQNVGVS
ncbi:polysaccharide biosynthesis protein [candidate division KSB1 bacterium]|nr:polysaccharide biosynthesis protein [candidate division KSB1 bacterium]